MRTNDDILLDEILSERITEQEHTKRLYNDEEYCFETISEDLDLPTAVATIKAALVQMSLYGHTISINDILDTV